VAESFHREKLENLLRSTFKGDAGNVLSYPE
jgi:hypothetical protein